MKKQYIFIIYIFIILGLGYLGKILGIILFKFYDKFIFKCLELLELCGDEILKSLISSILTSVLIVVFLGYFIFKYFKKYINKKNQFNLNK